jgi:chromosome segregation ATPase
MISEPELARLDRIESKIDKMSESLISLARAEEKIAAIEEDRADQRKRELWYEQKINALSDEIHLLGQRLNKSQNTFDVISKLFWVTIVAVAGTAATQIFPIIGA